MTTRVLTQASDPIANLFGPTIAPPPALQLSTNAFVQFGFRAVFVFIGLYVLYQMIMGAIDWIGSQGEDKKIEGARSRIQNAVIGMVLSVVVIVLWTFVAGDMLGIVKRCPDGSWMIQTPTFDNKPQNPCIT